jgi:hypothetical protein
MKNTQGCAETVWDNLNLSKYPCSRTGTIRRDTDWFCWQHSPEAVEKRRAERQARWADENRQSNEAHDRLAAERLAVGFLATTALEAGIVKATFTSHDRLINAARAAAVELRDIGTVTPSGKFCPQLIRIAQSLESALKEAHDDTA